MPDGLSLGEAAALSQIGPAVHAAIESRDVVGKAPLLIRPSGERSPGARGVPASR
ncbi:hypothetical protein [Streptosporangium sp. NPDC051022]|uniref:hypothetical protein n=1 Tax=Streptosporangium sp. NPDC051022 TaxID=3155752 RepID=UPI00342A1F7E